MSYKLGSLFDGSGGFPLSGALCGVEPVWAAEVEPYPIAVTRSRFPNMKHLGDISKVNGGEIEPVDIITFGSPCQDLSVAGKRAGLKHEANGDEETTRSGLFMEAVRIIKEMRRATNGKYPRFALWENVPGAFSSNKGEDFRIVCEELIKIVEPSAFMPSVPKGGWSYADSYVGDGWSLAYRVFDAQHWGVPQRRRRIHLVADFTGQCAREVLFEREGVRGYFAEGRTPWQTTPADAQGSTGADDREGESLDRARGGQQLDAVGFDAYNQTVTGDVAKSLTSRATDTDHTPVVIHPDGNYIDVEMEVAVRKYEVDCAALCTCLREHKAQAGISNKDLAEQLDLPLTMVEHWFRQDTYFAVPEPEVWPRLKALLGIKTDEFDQSIMTFEFKGGNYDMRNRIHLGDTAPTLTCGSGNALHLLPQRPVSYAVESHPQDSRVRMGDQVNQTLSSNMGHDASNGGLVLQAYSVENHPADSRVNLDESGKVQTLTSRMGTGGGNVPMVMEPKVHDAGAFCPETGGNDPSRSVAYQEGLSPTLRAGFTPATVYAVDRAAFNQGENAKYDFEITDSGVNSTLVARGPSAVAYGFDPQADRDVGKYVHEDVANTIVNGTCPGFKNGVAYVDTTHADDVVRVDDVAAPLQARDVKGGKLVQVQYIVRRLTPTECARLQGFADWWGIVEQKDNLTEEEYQFWLEVRNTHATINGKAVKDYTKKQMLTWYNKLYTDSAEYKMWGNGIALPPALYCLQGIVDALNKPEEDDDSWLM